jgi:hypothetical protein
LFLSNTKAPACTRAFAIEKIRENLFFPEILGKNLIHFRAAHRTIAGGRFAYRAALAFHFHDFNIVHFPIFGFAFNAISGHCHIFIFTLNRRAA